MSCLFLLEASTCRSSALLADSLLLTRGVAVSYPLLSSMKRYFFLLLLVRRIFDIIDS